MIFRILVSSQTTQSSGGDGFKRKKDRPDSRPGGRFAFGLRG
jgi:hypothetical protein